jgi:aryl-alcohol dehydrogenase-like predicted oxidoreductase
MLKTNLPGTDLITSRLGFGTASLHHLPSVSQRCTLLQAVLNHGVTHFDTARMYGEGMAERTLGDFLAGGIRSQVTLASKFGLLPHPWLEGLPPLMYAQRALAGAGRQVGLRFDVKPVRSLTMAAAEASLTRSLRVLRTDWLDILFVHEPRRVDIPDLFDLIEWLQKQQRSGRVRYLGLAGHAEDCLEVHRALPGVFGILQVEDSIAKAEAEVIRAAGLPLQITFGYLRQAREVQQGGSRNPVGASSVIAAALMRNPSGMILVSTRNAGRLRELVAPAEGAGGV